MFADYTMMCRKQKTLRGGGPPQKDRAEKPLGVPCHQFRAVGRVNETHAVCPHR